MNTKLLETAAIRGHRAGTRWADFYAAHREAIEHMRLFDRDGTRRLLRRLTYLLTCGDVDGFKPVGDSDPAPWSRDEAEMNKPHDSLTQACINWEAAGVVPVAVGGVS